MSMVRLTTYEDSSEPLSSSLKRDGSETMISLVSYELWTGGKASKVSGPKLLMIIMGSNDYVPC